jgi:hypothetical protein
MVFSVRPEPVEGFLRSRNASTSSARTEWRNCKLLTMNRRFMGKPQGLRHALTQIVDGAVDFDVELLRELGHLQRIAVARRCFQSLCRRDGGDGL